MDETNESVFSKIVLEARKKKYRTAKEYWESHADELKVSYPHYSTVEAGKKLPDIGLAIAIAKTLKIELRTICHLWAKEQMPDPETRAFFDPVPGREIAGIPATLKDPIDDFYVFTEKQIDGFKEHRHLWDVISFIMAFGSEKPVTISEIAQVFGLPEKEVDRSVDWLRNEGLVFTEQGALRPRRKYYHIPNTEAFKAMRDRNLMNAVTDLLPKISHKQLADKEAFRTVFMRRLTPKQAQEISKRIDDLIGHLGNFDDDGRDFYALAIAFGSRAHFAKKHKKTKAEE